MAWHPTEANTCVFVAQCPGEAHNMTNERVFRFFTLNRLQARHWVRVEYNIVLYRIYVPIIVQYQGNGCSLSNKDGAVIRESLGQLAACRLTILKMAVDDHCRPHPLTLMAAEGMLILHLSLLRWYGGCWQNNTLMLRLDPEALTYSLCIGSWNRAVLFAKYHYSCQISAVKNAVG